MLSFYVELLDLERREPGCHLILVFFMLSFQLVERVFRMIRPSLKNAPDQTVTCRLGTSSPWPVKYKTKIYANPNVQNMLVYCLNIKLVFPRIFIALGIEEL